MIYTQMKLITYNVIKFTNLIQIMLILMFILLLLKKKSLTDVYTALHLNKAHFKICFP
jgi:hypothetical protein